MALKEITVALDDRSITVKKVPLRHYGDLIKAFQKIAVHFTDLQDAETNDILAKLPEMIDVALPELSEFISAAVLGQLTPEEIQELDLAELTDIAAGVLEVNKVERVIGNVKKLMALRGNKTAAPTETTETASQS